MFEEYVFDAPETSCSKSCKLLWLLVVVGQVRMIKCESFEAYLQD